MSLRPVVLLLAVLPAVSVAEDPAPLPEPLAVHAFRNATADETLAWLGLGIAETVASDLRARGFAVVERTQLLAVTKELALQQAAGTDDTGGVAALGRLANARTVLAGTYQRFGGELRITASLIDPQTGVVLRRAKSTGPMRAVFALQDELVSQLVGGLRTDRPTPPSSEQTLAAFEAYALGIAEPRDDARAAKLKEALALDPSFRYAKDELAAVEKRLEKLKADAAQQRTEKLAQERSAFAASDGEPPAVRSRRAVQLLNGSIQARRYRALLADARAIAGAGLPPSNGIDPAELASYAVVLAHQQLAQLDLAIQAGEKHLAAFPTGTWFPAVEAMVTTALTRKQRAEEGRAALASELAGLDAELAEARKDPDAPGFLPRTRGLAFRRCSAAHQHAQWLEAIAHCTAYATEHGATKDAGFEELGLTARWIAMMSEAELGRFDRAKALGDALAAEAPAFARNRAIRVVMNTWPAE